MVLVLLFYLLLLQMLSNPYLMALLQSAAIIFHPYLSLLNCLLLLADAAISPDQVGYFAIIILIEALVAVRNCFAAVIAESHLAVVDLILAEHFLELVSFQGGFLLSLCAKIMAAKI